jgi:peptidoglycan hydrolase CwlO-like protein
MIRFLSVLIRNEQSVIDDLKMPILTKMTSKCSADVNNELLLKPIVAGTSKLYHTRDRVVDELKMELKKLDRKIKHDLIDHNSLMSKQEERELKKQFDELEDCMKGLKKQLDDVKEKCKVVKKIFKHNMKVAKKKKTDDYKKEVLVDFMIILRMIKKSEESILFILQHY